MTVQNHTHFHDIQGYVGESPRWEIVPEAVCRTAPYNRICEIVGRLNGDVVSIGSGWYSAEGVVLTAAHVIDFADLVEVRFADSETWFASSDLSIHGNFHGADGRRRPGSAFDTGWLRVPATRSLEKTFALPSDGDRYRVIGFSGGNLVEHADSGYQIEAFIAHNADTAAGHSGCPVFCKGEFAGIHVGLFSATKDYLTGKDTSEGKFLNSAVRVIDQELR